MRVFSYNCESQQTRINALVKSGSVLYETIAGLNSLNDQLLNELERKDKKIRTLQRLLANAHKK